MKRNCLEWAVLAGSAAVVVVLVGILVGTGVFGGDRPPSPSVTLRPDDGRESPSGWVIPATVINEGDVAAEEVVLEASAGVGDGQETSQLTVDYLAPGTEIEIEFGFSARPDGEVRVRVVGMRPSG